jgi:hypothetical protein
LPGLQQHDIFGFLPVNEKAARNEHENTQPEHEAALSLQAGFAKQVFEAAIGHVSLPFNQDFPGRQLVARRGITPNWELLQGRAPIPPSI